LNVSDKTRYFEFKDQEIYLKEIMSKISKERLPDFEIIDLSKENKEIQKIIADNPQSLQNKEKPFDLA
jgi:hypothetical protein